MTITINTNTTLIELKIITQTLEAKNIDFIINYERN